MTDYWIRDDEDDFLIGLDRLRGVHEGREVVILGSGPSLRHVAWESFTDKVVIAINSAIMVFPHADYFFTSDSGTTRTNHWRHAARSACEKVLPHSCLGAQTALGVDNVFLFEKEHREWKIDRDSEKLIFGIGSPSCAVHFAVLMGCTTIYLLGCDGQREGGRRHYWQFPGFEPDCYDVEEKDGTAWESDEVTKRVPYGVERPGATEFSDYCLCETVNAWKALKEANTSLDIRDASGGVLVKHEIFSAATLDEAVGRTNTMSWRTLHDRVGMFPLRGKHVGVPGVVVGSGPSTRFTAGREFRGRVVITVNSGAMLHPDADYFLSSDHGTVRTNHWKYVMRGTSHLILQYYMIDQQRRLGKDRVTIFQKNPGAWALHDFADSLIFGFGSAHCAAHAAVIMGCSPIYLVGCDTRFVDGKRHYWQFPGFDPDDIDFDGVSEEEWHARTMQHPYGQAYPGEDGTTDNHLIESLHGWQAIRKSSPEIDIRDASGGTLSGTVFPAATIDEAMGGAE